MIPHKSTNYDRYQNDFNLSEKDYTDPYQLEKIEEDNLDLEYFLNENYHNNFVYASESDDDYDDDFDDEDIDENDIDDDLIEDYDENDRDPFADDSYKVD